MQTIPEKLNAMRQSLEAGQSRRELEIRRDFGQKLTDAAAVSEESIFARTIAIIGPQIEANNNRVNDAVPMLLQKMEEAMTTCSETASSVRADSINKLQELTGDISAIRVEIPSLRCHVKETAEAVQRVVTFQPEVKEALAAMRADMATQLRDMALKIDDERRRAEAAETLMNQVMQENASKTSSAIGSLAEQAREQAATAMNHAGCVQDRVLSVLDDASRKASEAMEMRIAEVNMALGPAIKMETDEIMRQVHQHRDLSEDRLSQAGQELRVELAKVAAEVTEACGKSAEQKAGQLSATLSASINAVSAEVAGVREAGRKALEEASADLFVKVEDMHRELDEKSRELQASIAEGEQRLHASGEANLKKVSNRFEYFEESVSKLTLDSEHIKTALEETKCELMQDMQKDLQGAVTRLQEEAKVLGHHCDTHASDTAADLGLRLRKELQSGLGDVNKFVEALRSALEVTLEEEQDTRRSELLDMERRRVKGLHDCSVELQAALASASAEATARSEAGNRRVDSLAHTLSQLGQGFEALSERSGSGISRLQGQFKASLDEFETALQELKETFKDELRRASENVEAEVSHLEQQIALASEAAISDITDVRTELPLYARLDVTQEGIEAAKVALAKSAENTARVNTCETELKQQRAWFEEESKELASRCLDTHNESTETRLRVQQETSALGSELSVLRGAATSLTHGVIKTLHILGLLDSELEALVPSSSDGRGSSPTTMDRQHWGVDVADLLEWEKKGQGLAYHLTKQWQPFERAGLPNLLTLVERKANEADLKTIRSAMVGVPTGRRISTGPWAVQKVTPGPSSSPFTLPDKPMTPSTQADESSSASATVDGRAGSALSIFMSSPHPGDYSPSPTFHGESPAPRRASFSARASV